MKAERKTFACDLREISRRIESDVRAFIEEAEAHYELQIAHTAARIAAQTRGCQIVWMCGPSSVGKTTTAKRLCAELEARGVQAFTISLDDFYRGRGLAPRLADGSYDYESPEALDLVRLNTCVKQLLTDGETMLPRYDFTAGKPSALQDYLRVTGNSVVIFEGVHAFAPVVNAAAVDVTSQPMRVFLNTESRFTDGDTVLLSRREIRLTRRMLRDERTRDSDFANTISMWDRVFAGEKRYIFPYVQEQDLCIDTTLWYEPCVMRTLLLDRLDSLRDTPCADTAAHLALAYERFPSVSTQAVPTHSVLREFIGS